MCLFCSPHGNANLFASRRRFWLKINCHGFPKACDHKYLFNRRLDRFDHCLSEICSALGRINTLADRSTFKPAAGTVSDSHSHSHSRACIKSNTHSYPDSEPDTITKPSTCPSASPTSTPPPIAVGNEIADSQFPQITEREIGHRAHTVTG